MKANAGFTLIEVLVAVVILAVGLLGLAGLQAVGLSNNQSAYNRSQATQLAYDIADRMRSNPTAAANYVTAGNLATCPNNTTPCTSCTAVATTCSPIQLAQKDLFDWNRAVVATLPNGGSGLITNAAGVYTVTISWDDDKSVAADLGFTMSIRL